MKSLLRVVAVWIILSGAVALLLVVTHLDVVGDHLGQPNSGARAAATGALLAGIGIVGVLMLYSGLQLWRLREAGRKLALAVSGGLSLLMVGSLAVDSSASVIGPLLISTVIVTVLASRPARALCGRPQKMDEHGTLVA
jgi:hypothetical protein